MDKTKKSLAQRIIAPFVSKRSAGDFTPNPVFGTLRFSINDSYKSTKAMKLSTVYRCVNLLSDSIAALPLIPYRYEGDWKYVDNQSKLNNLLNIQPNALTSAFIFKKLMVINMLLKGSAYILVKRDSKTNDVTALTLLNSDFITVLIVNGDIKYHDSLNKATYDKSQIIHLLNYTQDGLTGISTLEYAATTLGIAHANEAHSSSFWKSGGTMSGILRPVAGATMSDTQAKAAKKSLIAQLNTELGGESNSIVVLGDGLEYQSISINPKDSQLLESRQFNVIEICRFFNVPPSLAFSETGKFSTAEQQSLDFLNNSLNPLIEKIEIEFFRKLYLMKDWDKVELKFDIENLMRLDAVTKADYYSKLFQIGALTSNEIREKLDAKRPVKGGNSSFIQVNMQDINDLAYKRSSDNPTKQLNNQVL